MNIIGIIRAQKIAEQVAIKRDNKNQHGGPNEREVKRGMFLINEQVEEKSAHKIAKELKGEQVKDIMQCMRSQSINRMIQINEIVP